MTEQPRITRIIRGMQWWALHMAADEILIGGYGYPRPPDLHPDDISAVSEWLYRCADEFGELRDDQEAA